MSNFMKSVVEEVLNGKKTTTSPKSSKTTNPSPSQQVNDQQTLNQLIRPNYQNKNSEKRLSILHQPPKQELPTEQTRHTQATKEIKTSRSALGDSISQLKKVSYSNGKAEKVVATSDSALGLEQAKFIGSTKDDTSIWFFPSVHSNLSQMFQRPTSGYSVAVVNAKICYPSQLIFLNEWLNLYPNLKYHLTWSKATTHPFTLELYDTDSNRLEKIAQDTLAHFSKRAVASVETYQVVSPSAWVSKQLGVMKSVESIGIVEGLSYFNNLLLLDQFYKTKNIVDASIQVEQHYLLTTGKTESVKETLLTLKKMASFLKKPL